MLLLVGLILMFWSVFCFYNWTERNSFWWFVGTVWLFCLALAAWTVWATEPDHNEISCRGSYATVTHDLNFNNAGCWND